ncbi:hypothetical protein HGQ17_03165 [Nesterenkonia sp. MY13]|uniref:Type VII secretion integral membrane protein EccD n=1 Tax=Nesterenkonia sedimenti TaxID=1463632 RepID=A0A7X8TI79_9MICC|nr:hypothetical protein [Nesterenkonia sedimenti]NLS09016.1 hypothetical protein [Nesterenkonia sedimenti]
MKYSPVALAAVVAAAALAGASWLGVAAMTVVVCALCLVVALGWPQLMGVTARKSLSAVILTTGVVAAVGAGIVTKVESLFFWSSVALAFGVMIVFIIQVLRGSERPHRLESTLGACAGVVITTTAAGWVAGLRYPAGMAGTDEGDGLGMLRVRGLFPYEDWEVLGVTGPGGELSVVALAAFSLLAGCAVACLPVRDRIVLPLIVLTSTLAALGIALLWGELTLLFAGVLGLAAGVLLASFRRFLVLQGPPEQLLSRLAVGAAPIAGMGAVVYFTERLLFV